MDPLYEAKKLVQLAYGSEESENRQQAILLAIAQALIAIADELRERNVQARGGSVEPEPVGQEPVRLRGSEITREDVLQAMGSFDVDYPDTNEYRSWLDNPAFHYAVLHSGRQYPPVQLLRIAAGIQKRATIDRQQYEPVFQQLGFAVVPKQPEGE